MKQICVIGPSGTGKTTLAKYIAARFRLRYESGSARQLLQLNDIYSHEEFIELCVKDPVKAYNITEDIYKHRIELLEISSHIDPLIVDRGFIDLLVYTHTQLTPFIDRERESKISKLIIRAINVNHNDIIYIFLPFTDKIPIADNGFRKVNREYQYRISRIFKSYLKQFIDNDNVITIEEWDWEKRIKIIEKNFALVLRKDKKQKPSTFSKMIKGVVTVWLKK